MPRPRRRGRCRLRLDLAQQSRVLLDMSGSGYTTILDVRQGATCPGVEVPDDLLDGMARYLQDRMLANDTPPAN